VTSSFSVQGIPVKRAILSTLLKYGLGISLLAFLISRNWGPGPKGEPGLGEVLQRPMQWGPLFLAMVICTVSLLLSFVRWYFLVRATELPFTLSSAFRLGLVGYFWNTFFPGSVGGDAVKAYYLARDQNRRTVAVATVLIDRAVGLWALFWFVAILGSAFWYLDDPALHAKKELQVIVLGALGLVAFTSLLWIVLVLLPERRGEKFAGRLSRLPKVGGVAAEFWRAIWMYRQHQGIMIAALLMALVGHVGWVMAFYYSAQVFLPVGDLAQIPSLTEHYVIVPIGMTIQALFPAPGGLGGGEYGFAQLYSKISPLGMDKVWEINGYAASLAQRMITWGLAVVAYLVYALMPRPVAVEAKEEMPDEEPPPKAVEPLLQPVE
jgi:uncharacterized protein (TIRG00374 family)